MVEVSGRFLASLDEVDPGEWNRITGIDYPFLRHEFLYGLERTGCTRAETGWQPCHLTLTDDAGLGSPPMAAVETSMPTPALS